MGENFERLCSYDILSLQDKCPAFAGKSCPFKNLVNDDFKKLIKNCPEFRDHCPFKDATNLADIYKKLSQIPDPQCPSKNISEMFTAIHSVCESQEQSLGNCPVFVSGCPFKTVENAGVKLVDPAKSVAALQQVAKSNLMKIDVPEIKQKCLAFKESCPYAKLADENVKTCPAFNDGCPFKNAKNLADVYDLFLDIPGSHSQGKYILDALKTIHSVSSNTKSVIGKCPLFHDQNGKPSCPFKNARSEGKHLVQSVNQAVQE